VELNQNEQFVINITAKNSDGNEGVQINNVCYHVSVDDPNVAKLIPPPSSIAVARESSSSNSPLVKPGTPENKENVQQQLFLFRPAPNDILIAGGGDSFQIKGLAGELAEGTNVKLHVHGEVDLAVLFPPDQQSPTTHQPVNIKPT